MHADLHSPNPSSNATGVACGDLVVWVCRYCESKNVYRAFNVQCCMDCAHAVCADARDQVSAQKAPSVPSRTRDDQAGGAALLPHND